jgi:hypothetical protein
MLDPFSFRGQELDGCRGQLRLLSGRPVDGIAIAGPTSMDTTAAVRFMGADRRGWTLI